MKLCKKCNQTKELACFNAGPRYKGGLKNWCRDCEKSYSKTWHDLHKEDQKPINSAWRQKNIERVRECERLRCKKSLPKLAAKNAKRHAMKLQRTPKWLTKQQLTDIEAFYYLAADLTAASGIPHDVDHIVPLLGKNVSGLHVPWNLRVILASENRSKGNKFP